MPTAWHRTHVIKKLTAKSPGAKKLAQRYGNALVCVRHRHNAEGSIRYTTVELVVEQAHVNRRKPSATPLGIRLVHGETDLRRDIIAAGGQWDPHTELWWLPRGAIRRLKLSSRVETSWSVP